MPRQIELAVQVLIVLSLVAFSIETLPDITPSLRRYLTWFETFSVVIFTVEYLWRIWAADDRRSFLFSFFGVVDLLAILPFWIGTGIDLRSVRAFRMLRLFRLFKLARYSKAVRRFRVAFQNISEELTLFGAVSSIILFIAAVGIYHFEHEAQPEAFGSVFDSLWWAVATLTTVGYGDVYPITLGGRIFTFVVLVVGLGIVAIPAGLVASALSDARSMEISETSESC
ncbi:MAG: ion transporter [Planctomycetota bacterium]